MRKLGANFQLVPIALGKIELKERAENQAVRYSITMTPKLTPEMRDAPE